MSVMYNEVGSRESDASARDSLIFFAMQPVSYSFARCISVLVRYIDACCYRLKYFGNSLLALCSVFVFIPFWVTSCKNP